MALDAAAKTAMEDTIKGLQGDLETDIKTLLDDLKTWKGESGKTTDDAVDELALKLSTAVANRVGVAVANAVDIFVKKGKVTVTMDITGALALAFTAAAVAPTDGGLVLKTNMAAALPVNWGTAEADNAIS